MILIIGTYSNPDEPGIHIYRYDQRRGDFELAKVIDGIANPSYLTLADDEKTLYAISENKTGVTGQLSAYALDMDPHPQLLYRLTYEGTGSCFVSVDTHSRHAFIANYKAGSLVLARLPPYAAAASVSQLVRFEGSGPDPERQEGPHIHSAMLSPDEQVLYCTDLGADRLYCFHYEPEADKPLAAADPPYIVLPPGSGPRHMAFSPDKRWLYVISELSGQIFVFSAYGGLSQWHHQVSILAGGYIGKIEAGDIQVHPQGHCLYTSSRGDANEIVVFNIDRQNGNLIARQRISAEGRSPRSLLIWEEGKLLIVANEQSDSVCVYLIDEYGELTYTGTQITVRKPACLKLIS